MRNDLILFDTNVWRRLVHHDQAMEMRAALKRNRRKGAVSPVNVDELVRTPIESHCRAMVNVACRRWWERLMPVAFLDIDQLIGGVRRHRPEWLRATPNTKQWAYERAFYLTNDDTSFWQAVHADPHAYAAIVRQNDLVRK